MNDLNNELIKVNQLLDLGAEQISIGISILGLKETAAILLLPYLFNKDPSRLMEGMCFCDEYRKRKSYILQLLTTVTRASPILYSGLSNMSSKQCHFFF